MRRRGKRELAALLTVALLAGSAACGADAGEKDAATGTAEAAAGQQILFHVHRLLRLRLKHLKTKDLSVPQSH